MSIKAVKEFYEKISSNEDFQNKLNELQNKATEGLEFPLAQDKKEKLMEDVIIPFAKEQGFDFSIEDIKEFEQSIIKKVDEKQLENLFGGKIDGGGIGGFTCLIVGFGAGICGVTNKYDETAGGLCLSLGFGWGYGICLLAGWGDNFFGHYS